MTKLSFTTMGTPEMTGREAIQTARKYGYQGVDMRVSDRKGELTAESTDAEIGELRGVFDSEGIDPAGLLCYNDVGSAEDGSWEKMETSILRHLDIGGALGSPNIRIFGGRILEFGSVDDFIARSAEVISRVLDQDNGPLGIVLQNHLGSYTFMQGVELARQVNNPRFGMVFSPDHCLMMGEDFDEVLAVAKSVSKQMYAADVTRLYEPETDREYRGILPGGGVVPLKQSYEAIGGNGFDGWVSFKWEKIWQDHLEEPEVALPHFIKFFKESMT